MSKSCIRCETRSHRTIRQEVFDLEIHCQRNDPGFCGVTYLARHGPRMLDRVQQGCG